MKKKSYYIKAINICLKLSLICTAFFFSTMVQAQPQKHILFDFDWYFHLGDTPDANNSLNYPEVNDLTKFRISDIAKTNELIHRQFEAVKKHTGEGLLFANPNFDNSAWQMVTIPHDWAVGLPYNKNGDVKKGYKDIDSVKGTSIGWYRKRFYIPLTDKKYTINIEFDGIYRNSLVWLNGHCLGRNVSGYIGFAYLVNKYLNYGGDNTIAVRVDASHNEGWFYEGAGIYRHVWLNKTLPLHVSYQGTYVHSILKNSEADITIETELSNACSTAMKTELISAIFDRNGRKVAEAITNQIIIRADSDLTIIQHIKLDRPSLWNLSNPYLYKLRSSVNNAREKPDVYFTNFGIRTISWDANTGFYLNNIHIPIRGTCNHQDHAGIGTALPDEMQYYRLNKLKQMGCNAYRTAHNAPTPELLAAADRLGLLVMDETRRMGTDSEALSQLKRLVKRDRNHPSVIIWSIGNEEEDIQGTDTGAQIASTMQSMVHKLDNTRPVTVAMNGKWGKGFSNIIDVQGFNYKRLGDIDEFHAAFPGKPEVATEEGSSHSTRGEYKTEPDKGWVSSYLPVMRSWTSAPEDWLSYYAARPWVAGLFIWTGFDYRGEPAFKHWPCTGSSYGFMDQCGFPKDYYYLLKANWTHKPVMHIMPHWNWPTDSIGKPINVQVFSNADEVELLLNGRSLGKKNVEPFKPLKWVVNYQPGTLFARGYKNKRLYIESKIETTTRPYRVLLTSNKKVFKANGTSIAIITFKVTDKNLRVDPVADNDINFMINGPGKIIGLGNGNPSSDEMETGNQRKVFNGYGQLIIQSTRTAGLITLSATARGLKTSNLTLKSM